jgi:very-short-patch-repair endonuclease
MKRTSIVPDEHVKFLRHHQTCAEHRLWLQIRSKRIASHRFRRQVRLDRYVADFVCFSLRLIIEVDGPSHELTVGQDEIRTRRLEAQGYRIIRFSNEQVMRELDSVVETIRAVIAEMTASAGFSGALPRANPAP